MSQKHYVANNTKYYKHSNSSGEMGHVDRILLKDKNAFSSLTKNNFGHTFDNETLNLHQNYLIKLDEAKKQSPRAIQKHSNTFIDSVLAFDNELMFDILQTENGQEKINNSIKNYMNEFKEKYGFEPIGFQFHNDEGTFYTQKQYDEEPNEELKKRLVPTINDENGEHGFLKQNFHAQAIFLNFSKETGKSCLRGMKREDWGDVQDLLHKHFKEYGFDRGEYKLTSESDHKTKADYVRDLKIQKEKLEKEFLKEKIEYADLLDDVLDDLNEGIEKVERFDKIQSKAKSLIKKLGNNQTFKDLVSLVEKKKPVFFESMKKQYESFKELLSITDSQPPSQKLDEKVKEKVKLEDVDNAKDKELDKLKNDTDTRIDEQKEKLERVKQINNKRKYSKKGKGQKNR